MFVAECVRVHGSADIAVLNSGSFRADATLPQQLRDRDLRETFLYDAKDAVLVLEMPGTAIDAMLAHGLSKIGTGAYPQFSDKRGNGAKMKIAVVAHLLKTDMDGYVDALATSLKLQKEDVRRQFGPANAMRRFSIVDAVLEQSAHVAYQSVASKIGATDPATEFVGYARTLSLLFHRKQGRRLKGPGPWNSAFRSLIDNDRHVSDGELRNARENLRTFLRKVASDPPRIAHLQALRKEVASHRARFEDGIDYQSIFDAAAKGIAGWRP
jgi:hypothetical protein